ncbi:hypothetical protein [Parvibaculum sedimenti]|nr:hypothetical protein [Parvibaculum sedimenti]
MGLVAGIGFGSGVDAAIAFMEAGLALLLELRALLVGTRAPISLKNSAQ